MLSGLLIAPTPAALRRPATNRMLPWRPARVPKPRPRSCDTFVALPPATAGGGGVVFGTNSDRETEVGLCTVPGSRAAVFLLMSAAPNHNMSPPLLQEVQEVVAFGAGEHPPGASLQCTYIAIPQAPRTYAVVLSKPS